MSEIGGYTGKILRVDLTTRKITTENTDKYSAQFLGGYGIALKIMWDEVPPEVGPFDPENRLILCPGVLTGTPSPSSGRVEVVGKSPHTYPRSTCTRSGIGGKWGSELKRAGYDLVIVQGKASGPVVLKIKDDDVEIIDAEWAWGLDNYAAQEELKKRLGDSQYKIMVTGPAGENLVRFACLLTDTGHAAGQGGFGAVMGSKKLKAIAVRGTKGVRIAKPKELLELVKYVKTLVTSLGATPKSMLWADKSIDPHDVNRIPYRYRSVTPGYPKGIEFISKYWVKQVACSSCPVGDYVYANVPGVGSGELHCTQWYYANLSRKTDEVTFAAKYYHDGLGINCYEFFYMIPWLQRLYQKKIITEEGTGIKFSAFPKHEFIVPLLHKVAYRSGFGDILAEGVARAAEKLGVLDDLLKVEAFPAAGYGGQGMCSHYDPRDWVHSGLLWAVDERDPYCDQHSYISLVSWSGLTLEEQKAIAEKVYGSGEVAHARGKNDYSPHLARAAILDQDRCAVKNSLGLCDWVFPLILSPLKERNYMGDTSVESKLFSTVTGIDRTEEELLKIGERISNLKRAISVRDGRRKADDQLPDYFFTSPAAWLSPKLDRAKWEALKDEYYRSRGWNVETGIPTRAKLEALGLKDVADKLEKLG